MAQVPTGTVTFLFTDIEGSTERWQRDDRAMAAALVAHDELLRTVAERHGGTVFKHTGDGMCVVFPSAPEAVAAAIDAQAELELPVRMGLHTGEAEARDGDYFGPTLNRAARVMDAGHGGQILVSAATAGLVRHLDLVDLGEHHLKGLETSERIHQVGRGEFPPLRTPRPMVGNLPVQLTTFVGRTHEVKSLAEELEGHRLVTLIGVGGTGKTRLAIETAASVADAHPDGCWMIELAMVTVNDGVPFAFCTGLGFTAPPDGDVVEHVVSRLRHKRCLVLVDNCEHVLAATADVVERLVAACPGVAILATSREPLMVRGERLVPVPSLAPDDAERLFLQRARDEAPDLVIDDDQLVAVAALCQRLDGLPLALELAASRVRALTPVELVANLEERFRMLVGGRRSRLERHQTMRGTLDWSYDLCSELEQTVFDRLSVFPAAFDLAAARAVAGGDGVDEYDVVDVVPQLVDRSLVQRSTALDGTTRYRMLETMRAYGREHLQHQALSDVVRGRHAQYMARTLASLTLRTLGPDEVAVQRRIAEYLPDAVVATDWFIDHQEWENAQRVALGDEYVSARESAELASRLHAAARASGLTGPLLDELERNDTSQRLRETLQHSIERGWRTIRAAAAIATDRFEFPPHIDFNDGGLRAEDVDEFVASVSRWDAAPTVTRFFAGWLAIRALAYNHHGERAAQLLETFDPYTASLQSRRAARLAAELHGVLAMVRNDWIEGVRWYSVVVAENERGLQSWFDLVATWHLLTARGLSPEPMVITGDDLRQPWRCFQEQHLDVLCWHGATATAIALHRLGHDDLANRFIAWVRVTVDTELSDHFLGRAEAAGLPTVVVESHDDLDTLIAETYAIADELDRASHRA
jgi:predicted ATPase